MTDTLSDPTTDLGRFRSEIRKEILAQCPESMRQPLLSDDDACWGGRDWIFKSEDQRLWMERAVARGWTAPGWPRAYGGGELEPEQEEVLRDEMMSAGCRLPIAGWGLTLIGPTLLRYGTEEQKQKHLPPIARGEIRWCQGFSEPGAGSDLASLQTRADLVDGEFIVNGQKVWTTYGHFADWMFCLVRTDREAPKHLGISFLLIDMTTPGITIRPMPLISGSAEFCEIFFDNVRVPAENLVGELNRGWDVAKYLLGAERRVSGKVKAQVGKAVGQLLAEAGRLSATGRSEVARFDIEAWGLSTLLEEMAALAQAGIDRPGFGQVVKYIGSELNKWRYELLMAEDGYDALLWSGPGEDDGKLAKTWLRTKANSIAGGSNEMQFNMLGKSALGLPNKPSLRATSGETVDLDPDHRQIRETVQAMLGDAREKAYVRAARGTELRYSPDLWRSFAEAGLAGLLVPEPYGGSGLGHAEASIVLQEIGRAMIPLPFLATSVVAATALIHGGSEAQKQRFLPGIADGSMLYALAVDEASKHSSTIGLRATAKGDGFTLDGTKTFVADGGICDHIIVAAGSEGGDGISLFVVASDAPGVTITRRHLIDDRDVADIGFANVAVTRADLLGAPGQGEALLDLVLDAGRTAIAGELLGLGDEGCDRTVAYLKERRQFDHYLSEYQALQHRIGMVHMRLELTRTALKRALRHLDANDDERMGAVAAAKHLAIGAATMAVQESVQMHGGVAMTDAYDIGFLMKRARVLAELYGDAHFHADRFAKTLGY
jgi:alkylation response protein AidB-like acyl-CoA dehydrogenase